MHGGPLVPERSYHKQTQKDIDKYEPLVSDRIAQVFKQRDMSIFNNVNVREVKRINSTNKQENSSSVQIVLDDGHTTTTAEELLVAEVGNPDR
jgi:pyruvate/2-oxoglutarate dehydrogenase complex dihydrolipoamide dehydrogenase (E3) component